MTKWEFCNRAFFYLMKGILYTVYYTFLIILYIAVVTLDNDIESDNTQPITIDRDQI